MNYYPHHIGDFRSGTVNMSRQARWIYRDMMDIYYDTEKPLPLDLEVLCDMLGVESEEESRIVERILRFKFTKTDAGYVHARCDEEIAAYHVKADTAKANGKLGGRPRKAKGNPEEPIGFPSGSNPQAIGKQQQTESQTNQEPRTNIYPVPSGTDAAASAARPDGLDSKDSIFQVAIPWLVERGAKEASARSMLGGAIKKLGADEAWRLARACMDEKPMEPIAWIAAALNKTPAVKKGVTAHGNLENQDFHAGIAADGSW